MIAFLLTLALVVQPTPKPRMPGSSVTLGGTRFIIWGGAHTGSMPKGASVSPDGRWLFVSNFGQKNRKGISVFRADPLTFVRYLKFPGNSIETIVSPDGTRLYSTNMYGAYLDVFSIPGFSHLSHIKVGMFPKIVITSKDGKWLFLSLWAGRKVARLSVPDYKKTYIPINQKNPRGLALSADGSRLYVASNGSNTLSEVDTSTLKVLRVIKLPRGVRHAITSRDGKRLYVSVMGPGAVYVFSLPDLKQLKVIKVGARPKSIEESYDGRFLYTANYEGHSMGIVDTKTWQSVQLPLDIARASGLVVRPDDRFIYVTGWCSDDIWAIARVDASHPAPARLGHDLGRRHLCRRCKRTLMGCTIIRRPSRR